MDETQQALYNRISKFSFDEGDEELTFARKLARENGWNADYTARVIDEYRRFMFLAMVAGHPVSPSEQVDHAWHLHLTCTHSYWDRFCGEVLGKPVHHRPTRGGREEQLKFDSWYENTRESYRRLFGHEPPADIWPDASIRFGDDLHFRRVNTSRNWVIPKPRSTGTAVKSVLLALLTLTLCGSVVGIKPLFGGDYHSPSATEPPRISGPSSPLWEQRDEPTPKHALSESEGYAHWIIILVLLGIAFVYDRFFAYRCPWCKRNHALYRTGAKDEHGQEEWKCEHCNYNAWKGGCAACGGCG